MRTSPNDVHSAPAMTHSALVSRTDARRKTKKRKKPSPRVGSKVPRRGTTKINMSGPARDYFSDLSKITGATEDAIRSAVFDKLDILITAKGAEEGLSKSAEKEAIRKIDRATKIAEERIEKLTSSFAKVAKRAASRSQKVHKTQQKRQLDQIGIDVFHEAPELNQVLSGFTRVNTRLIKSIPRDELKRVSAIMVDAVRKGRRAESVAKDIRREFGISKRRAKRIARDQTGTIAADLSRHRMASNGVDKAIWRSLDDNRVRETHEMYDDRVFKIADGIDGIRPGEEVECRCYSEPVL